MNHLNLVKPSTESVLKQMRIGDEQFLKDLYNQHRAKFILWFQKNHGLGKDEATEVYQKAFTIFYYNVKDGKLKEINSEITTYLFGIGKNLVKQVLRDKKRTVPIDETAENISVDSEGQKNYEASHQKFLVDKVLDKVGEPCKSLLLLYYFRNYSYEAIAINLGYKDERVVKKKKCLCLRKIRQQLSMEKNLL